MSRMFRIISGGQDPHEPLARSESVSASLPAGGEVPFVEIGGPDGLVSSVPCPVVAKPTVKPQAPTTSTPPATAIPAGPRAESTKSEPMRASQVLSVTFHRFPKQGMRVMDTIVAPEVVAYHFPDHPVSAEYRQVCEEILQQYTEPGPKVALFTAAASAAGTTTVLLNIATTMVQDHGHRVLLLDANFARPGVARRLSIAESPGLAEVLGQTLPLAWALQPTPMLNLHALSTGTPNELTTSALTSDFPRLLAQLRQWFDWVIVDAGIWSDHAGPMAAMVACDGLYLVSRHADIDRPEFVSLRVGITEAGGVVKGYISTRL